MKIFHKLKIAIMALAVLFTANACDQFSVENVNPTQSADMDPAFQLTRSQVTLSFNRYEYWRAQYIYTSCIIQHNASTFSYWSGDKYNKIDSYSSALFDVAYTREIKNLVDLVERTKDDPALVNFNAAARILKVYTFGRLTDLYGDIPYSEAGRGFLDDIYAPKYDEQQQIYNDFFNELDQAVNSFDATARPLSGDVFFSNDIEKWKRWGNSLRLRYGMRLTKVDPAKAEQEVRAAISGGVMQSNEDMAKMFHDNNNQNGNSQVMLADDNFRISEAFAEWLKERNDPRILLWFQMSDDAGNITTTDIQEFRGLPNGTDAENLEEGEYATFARHNRSTIKDVTNPYFHQSYAEVEFLLAEAALRGWGAPLSVAEHYERGVRAAMDHMNFYTNVTVTPDVVDGYVAANPFQAGTFEEQMQQIHEQLWAALYLDGMEAFANWRRTGYPELTPVDHPIGTTNGTIPRRLYYPPSELANNGENFQAALQRQFGGENELTGRVWWDQ